MEVKSLLMVMATLTIAGCSQNEMTEMNPDTNRTIGLDVYTEVQTRMRMAVGCMSLLANRSKYFFSSIFSI